VLRVPLCIWGKGQGRESWKLFGLLSGPTDLRQLTVERLFFSLKSKSTKVDISSRKIIALLNNLLLKLELLRALLLRAELSMEICFIILSILF